ncbi:polyprenol phosphomannose-dependent alpha 1,6 mannosyltransferase MptB [Nesterenkonia sp. AY15]|uniref:polyprenol phosphomannose-dependent alpha 1,6 mannosyltransferase MptB n=1 Tax=Nesterenkonia sp. AY15 TaxID=2901139 RepID=UPI001F4C86FD|nr:polyprenol phosphomannose-dependent alpha 1,6 mannosyltransferase MptB [Nesterenkonia sp. AY15]MCH8571452.1 polyprenol phosphomannose-dependent alpha 1,6 mannosyltransferase MptB [Nesterenkonia sp. AY15]
MSAEAGATENSPAPRGAEGAVGLGNPDQRPQTDPDPRPPRKRDIWLHILRSSTRPKSVWSPMVEGLLGSMLVLLGSFGVGWLVSVSPLSRQPWIITYRTETVGVVVATIALTLGCWVMLRAWLRLGRVLENPDQSQQWPTRSLRTVNAAVVLWSLPQLVALPIFSRDVFAYLNQGRLVLAGQDPYTTGVSTLDNWFQLGTDILWAESETPYGPLFLWLEAAVMNIAGESPDLALFLFRLACVGGVVMMMIFVPKLARIHGIDPARAQWITLANPLLIISFISSAHNDAIMVGFALAGIYAAAHSRGVLATLLVVVSIGIKPITIVLLPFIGLLWAGPGASWSRKFTYWFLTAGIAAAVMITIGLIQGYGFGWLAVLAGTGTGSVFWSPIGIADGWLGTLLRSFGLDSSWTLEVFKVAGRLLSVAVVLWLMFRGSEKFVVQRMVWAFTALVVLSPIIQPWYLLWLLPLFAITGIRKDWQFKWVVFTIAFFLTFGASDQLSIYQFLQLDAQMLALSVTVSWICIVWLALLDRQTRWVVWEGWGLPAVRWEWPRLRGRRSSQTDDGARASPAAHDAAAPAAEPGGEETAPGAR